MSNKQNNSSYNKGTLSPLGEAISGDLPELMNRNIKLGDRLKSKLRVSSLLNNIELRNQNYLKELVSSSDRNVQDLKSGLKLSKAMKLSSNKLSKLNSKILNDCFMKKNNIILNTKKTLKKNTEEETKMIIKKSINILRECISPTFNKVLEKPQIETNYKKFLSKSELTDVEKLINNKISEDENILKNKIKNYLDKVSRISITNSRNNNLYDYKLQKLNKDKNKNFYIYAKYFSLNDTDLKMINYEKIKPQPIRDKSCPNLENIKENLFPEIKTGKKDNENYVNINNSNGVRIINGMKMYRKIGKKNKSVTQDEKDININDIVVNNKKDSFNILKKIIIRNRSLINKTSKKYDKLSSIIDIKLPKISDYETMVVSNNKIINEKNQNDNDINNDAFEENNEIYNIVKKGRNKSEIYNNFSNLELIKEFKDLKDEIQILKTKKVDIEENYIKHKEDLMDLVFNFGKKQNQNRINNKLYLIDNKKLINKKILAQNPMIRLPSSHSVSVLKRKFKINNGNNNEYQKINKKIRNYSNHTRDRTNASSIKNSASSIFTTSKSENKFKEFFNYINIDKKKNILSNSAEVPSLLSPKKYFSDNTKNNAPSDNITILSDY